MVLAGRDGPWAQLRTGTVVEASGSSVSVLIGATTFVASVIIPFGIPDPSAAVPPVGSLVAVGRQDSSWTVFGSVLGASGNLILNGSFEDGAPGSFPADWTVYATTGAVSVSVEAVTGAVNGTQVTTVTTASTLTSTGLLYSSPVEVTAGLRYQLSAFVGAEYEEGTAETADADILALWFDDDVALYPSVTDPDVSVAAATDVVPAPPYTPLSGSVVAPVTGFLRLALRSVVAPGQTLLWDYATVREFG